MISDKQAALRILGVSEDASDDEVRQAYRRLCVQWHPDKNQDSREATHRMQQLNAARAKLQEEDEDDDYDDEEYSDDDYYNDDDDDDYDDDDDDDPFSNGRMDFAAFVSMFARMRAEGMIDDDGVFMGPPVNFGAGRRGGGGPCLCPKCVSMRRMDAQNKERRREEARRRKLEEEAAAAEMKAQEAADKITQQKDPRNSMAWRKGGESRERLIREHFLRQSAGVLLHEVTDSSMVLVLDVPDVSLLDDDGRLPPKGVEWEVSYCAAGDKKWTQLLAPKEYDNININKLTPGTEYQFKVRTGTAGSLTWSGSPDWGQWSKPSRFKTTGHRPAAAANGANKKGKAAAGKKKKNRDAAFAKLSRQLDEEQQQQQQQQQQEEDGVVSDGQQPGSEVGEEQQESESQSNYLSPQPRQQQRRQQQSEEEGGCEQQLVQIEQEQDGRCPAVINEEKVLQQEQAQGAAVGDFASSSVAQAPTEESAAGPSFAAAAAAPAGDDAMSDAGSGSAAAAAGGDDTSEPSAAAAATESDVLSLDDSDSEAEDELDPLAAAEAAAAAVEAAEAAGLPIPVLKAKKKKHRPVLLAPCVYYPLGKCKAGNACKFQHIKPSSSATAAAGGADANADGAACSSGSSKSSYLARLDALMSGGAAAGPSVVKAREVAQLCGKIISEVPKPRYQAKPHKDGFYLKPLFVTAYNVLDNSYAAWYSNMTQGADNRKNNAAGASPHRDLTIKAKIERVMGDQPSPAAAALAAASDKVKQPTMSAASGAAGSSSNNSSSGAAAVHKPRYPYFCKWYPMGTCRFGNNCQFVHQKGAQPAAAVPVPTADVMKSAATAAIAAPSVSATAGIGNLSTGPSSNSSGSSGIADVKHPGLPQRLQQQQQQAIQPSMPPQQQQQQQQQMQPQHSQLQYGQPTWQQQQQPQQPPRYGHFAYQPPPQQPFARPMYMQQPPHWQQQQSPPWQHQQLSMQQLHPNGAGQQPIHMQQPIGFPPAGMAPSVYKQG